MQLLPLILGVMTAFLPARTLGAQGGPDLPGKVEGATLGGVGFPDGFLENIGQWATPSPLVARSGSLIVRLEASGLSLQRQARAEDGSAQSVVARLALDPAHDALTWTPGQQWPGLCHFILGDGETHSGARRFGSASAATHSGDLTWTAQPAVGSSMELQIAARGAAALADIDLRWDGIDDMSIDDDGSLLMRTPHGVIRQFATCTPPGATPATAVVVRHRLPAEGRVRFDERDLPSDPGVVITLGLDWATFLGGDVGYEQINDLMRDLQGRTIAVGDTTSPDFPTTPGVHDTTYAGGGVFPNDAFVSCLSEDGSTLVFSTFIGGNNNDFARAVAMAKDGTIIVAGQTISSNFKTTPGAYDTHFDGGEAFIIGLTTDGTDLAFSTFLGGSSFDRINDVVVDASGRIFACGFTFSEDFPVTPNAAFVTGAGSNFTDGFLSVLNSAASQLLYSTYFTGSIGDEVRAIGILSENVVVLVGSCQSTAFPVTPKAFPAPIIPRGFISVLDISSGMLSYSTQLGERPQALHVSPGGLVTVGGRSSTGDLPATPRAFDPQHTGAEDGFVLQIQLPGGSLRYLTFLGGSSFEEVTRVHADSALRAVAVGYTGSPDFPTTPGAFAEKKASGGQGKDLFVTRLDEFGSKLIYSSFFGGSKGDGAVVGASLAVDEAGGVILGSESDSDDLPVTPGAHDTSLVGPKDAFIAHLSMLPAGVQRFGTSTPGALGHLAAGVTAVPAQDNPAFAMTCTSAPPDSRHGLLVLSQAPLSRPVAVKGTLLWVDPSQFVSFIPVQSDAHGYSVQPLRIPSDSVLLGATGFVQYIWFERGAWSASNALSVTVLPPLP